jgi:hypothetical protein
LPVYGAMSWGWPSARGKILSGVWLGVLTHVIPPGLVDEAVGDGLAWEMRLRLLPARVTAYFTLGLCLFSALPYQSVFLQVTAGLGLTAPATTALTAARRRLGDKPLESLFRRLCAPLSPGREPWSHVAGLLAVAWDGTGITVADTEANAASFGRPGAAGQGKGALPAPQIRLVMLIACGTRAVLGAAAGPCRGKGTGERALAGQLLGQLRAGMLLLADRGFYSWGLWNAAAATGAGLLWRMPGVLHLPVVRELPDGSFLSRIEDPAEVRRRSLRNVGRRRRKPPLPPDTAPVPGITVRVIEYALTVTGDDGASRTERYRLATTLLDWRACPAAMLAGAYSRRWAIETGWRECKTYLRGSGRALRGKTPALARQELWALLAVYQATRVLIARAAASAGLDPARISFTAALDAARRTMSAPRRQLRASLDTAESEILSALVPERPHRICARTVKRIPFARWPARKRSEALIPRRATRTATITPPGTSTPTSTDQHKQPATTEPQPP